MESRSSRRHPLHTPRCEDHLTPPQALGYWSRPSKVSGDRKQCYLNEWVSEESVLGAWRIQVEIREHTEGCIIGRLIELASGPEWLQSDPRRNSHRPTGPSHLSVALTDCQHPGLGRRGNVCQAAAGVDPPSHSPTQMESISDLRQTCAPTWPLVDRLWP